MLLALPEEQPASFCDVTILYRLALWNSCEWRTCPLGKMQFYIAVHGVTITTHTSEWVYILTFSLMERLLRLAVDCCLSGVTKGFQTFTIMELMILLYLVVVTDIVEYLHFCSPEDTMNLSAVLVSRWVPCL